VDNIDFANPKKQCRICKEFKELNNFYKAPRNSDGLLNCCIPCFRGWYKEHRSKNKEKYKEKAKRDYAIKKQRGITEHERKRHKAWSLKRKCMVDGRLIELSAGARSRSKKDKLPYDLNIEWLVEQWNKNEGRCLITGIPFDLSRIGNQERNPFGPSIDRIDNNRGYTKDNTRLVGVAVNLAINEWGEKIFTKIVKAYLENKGYCVLSFSDESIDEADGLTDVEEVYEARKS